MVVTFSVYLNRHVFVMTWKTWSMFRFTSLSISVTETTCQGLLISVVYLVSIFFLLYGDLNLAHDEKRSNYENTPIQIYYKFYNQKKKKINKIFRQKYLIFIKFLLKA